MQPETTGLPEKSFGPKTPARKLAQGRAWRAANPDRQSELSQRWRAENADYNREQKRAWKRANPAKVRAYNKGRIKRSKARRRAWLMEQQRGRCAYCRVQLVLTACHLDHIVPLKLGGSNRRSNLQLLCAPCNLSKGATHPVEFARSIGRLI